MLTVVVTGDEIVDRRKRGAVAVTVGADLDELGKDAVGRARRHPWLFHYGQRHEVAIAGDAFGGALRATAPVEHGGARRIQFHRANLLVVTLLVRPAARIGIDEIRREHADPVVEVARMEELAETVQVGGDPALVLRHRGRVVDDKHQVDFAAARAVGGDLFQAADRLDADNHEVFDAQLGVVFVDRVILEAVLADEPGVRRVGELARGAIDSGGAVLGFRLVIEHVGDLGIDDGQAILRRHEVLVARQLVGDRLVRAGVQRDLAHVQDAFAFGAHLKLLQRHRRRGLHGDDDPVLENESGRLVANRVAKIVLAGVVLLRAIREVAEPRGLVAEEVCVLAPGQAHATEQRLLGDGVDQIGARVGAEELGWGKQFAVHAPLLGLEDHRLRGHDRLDVPRARGLRRRQDGPQGQQPDPAQDEQPAG